MFPSLPDAVVEAPYVLGRVSAQDRGSYLVTTQTGELRARLAGALHYAAANGASTPIVGDFVALERQPSQNDATIRRLLPRANLFARRAPGGAHVLQSIAANVDTLFVAVAADGDFNVRRLERYLVGAAALGVPPALALTKIDLVDDPGPLLAAARAVAGETPVVALCALRPGGLDGLTPFRGPGRTIAFVGSSGVGKSTIVNALIGSTLQATASVRTSDDRGRHTTTRRELFLLDDGTAVIDTPGMREFALAGAQDGVAEAFGDVAAVAAQCRFRDCSHEREPGCAVRATIDPARLSSWRKLRREAEFEARSDDPLLARAERQKWKAIHKAVRAQYRDRRR